jgi:hypothetical protein
MWTVQTLTEFVTASCAYRLLACLCREEGSLGGRVLTPDTSSPYYRVQTFTEDCGELCSHLLPDGCTRVFVEDAMRRVVGIAA